MQAWDIPEDVNFGEAGVSIDKLEIAKIPPSFSGWGQFLCNQGDIFCKTENIERYLHIFIKIGQDNAGFRGIFTGKQGVLGLNDELEKLFSQFEALFSQ